MSVQLGSGGSIGHAKHRKSGTPKNHANSIQKVREFNKMQEEEKLKREARKPKMVSSVKDLFSK